MGMETVTVARRRIVLYTVELIVQLLVVMRGAGREFGSVSVECGEIFGMWTFIVGLGMRRPTLILIPSVIQHHCPVKISITNS